MRINQRFSKYLAVVVVLLTTSGAWSSTYIWQGGSGWWGDANWTSDGAPNQAVPSPDPVTFTGDAFTIPIGSGNTIQRNGPIRAGGGTTMDLTSGTLTITATGTYSAFNVTGNGAVVTLSGSSVMELAGGGAATRAFGGDTGAMVARDSAHLLITAKALQMTDNCTFTVQDDARVTVAAELDVDPSGAFVMRDNARVSVTYVQMPTSGANTSMELAGGTLILSDGNPLRSGDFAKWNANITAQAGELSIIHTNVSTASKTLAAKTAEGFLLVDGVRIDPAASAADLAVLNAELLTLSVAGRALQLSEDLASDTQTVTVVPRRAVWNGADAWWNSTNWVVNGVAGQTHPGAGYLTVITNGAVRKTANLLGGNTKYDLGGTGALSIDNELQVWADEIVVSDDFVLTVADYIQFEDSLGSVSISGGTIQTPYLRWNRTTTPFTMSGGEILLTNANGIRYDTPRSQINLTGAAGSTTIRQTDSSNAGATLARKVGANWFTLDGVLIDPATNGSDLTMLNAELRALGRNNRHIWIREDGSSQVLSLVNTGTVLLVR